MYFGSDEDIAGEAVGERIAAAGAKHPLCVIQEQGSGRAGGALRRVSRPTAPGTENLQVDGTDIPSVTSTIGAKLQQDPVHRLHRDARCAHRAGGPASRSSRPGSEAKVVTFDLNADVGQADQGRQDPVRGRPAAVPAGLPGGRLAVAVPDQQERHRRRPAGADRAVVRRQPTNIDAILPVRGEQHPLMSSPRGRSWTRPASGAPQLRENVMSQSLEDPGAAVAGVECCDRAGEGAGRPS